MVPLEKRAEKIAALIPQAHPTKHWEVYERAITELERARRDMARHLLTITGGLDPEGMDVALNWLREIAAGRRPE